jgi:excisionase family DNA binding protein
MPFNLLTIEEASRAFQISVPTLHRLTADRLISSQRVGHRRMYDKAELRTELYARCRRDAKQKVSA